MPSLRIVMMSVWMMFRIGFIREIFLEGIENINCYFVSVQFEYLLIKYVF